MCKHAAATIERSKHAKSCNIVRSANGNKDVRTLGNLKSEGRIKGNVWDYNSHNATGGDPSEHPAIMHESLAKDHIQSWSNPGDIQYVFPQDKVKLITNRPIDPVHLPFYGMAWELAFEVI